MFPNFILHAMILGFKSGCTVYLRGEHAWRWLAAVFRQCPQSVGETAKPLAFWVHVKAVQGFNIRYHNKETILLL